MGIEIQKQRYQHRWRTCCRPKLCLYNLRVEKDLIVVIFWMSIRERGSWQLDGWLCKILSSPREVGTLSIGFCIQLVNPRTGQLSEEQRSRFLLLESILLSVFGAFQYVCILLILHSVCVVSLVFVEQSAFQLFDPQLYILEGQLILL